MKNEQQKCAPISLGKSASALLFPRMGYYHDKPQRSSSSEQTQL